MLSAAYVTPNGQLCEAHGKAPMAFHGQRLVPVEAAELIPLPPGGVLSMLPDRAGLSAKGELPGAPAAALLPIGYTRTLLPAYVPLPAHGQRPGEGTSRKQSLKIASLPSLGLRLRRFAGLSHRDGRELWSLPTALT